MELEEEEIKHIEDYASFWVHQMEGNRVLVSRPPATPWRGHNCHFQNGAYHFKDTNGKKLIIEYSYRNNGIYTEDAIRFQEKGLDLDAEKIVLWDIQSGVPETYEYIHSYYGTEFLFRHPHEEYELVKGWYRMASNTYPIPEEIKKKLFW